MLKAFFSNLSIRHKMNGIILLVCTAILGLTSVAYFVHQNRLLHRITSSELETLCHVICDSSTAALTFNDRIGAEHLLQSLAAQPNIVEAILYTKNGDIFAQYGPTSKPQPDAAEPDDYVSMNSDIVLDDENIGQLAIVADFSDLRISRSRFVIFLIFIFILSMLFATVLSASLQRHITLPISQLSTAMEKISLHHDFSLRVQNPFKDELGKLCQGFNTMLQRIEEQDSVLKKQKENLSYLATHDALTDLPNRALLYDRLNQGLYHAQRNQTELLVMFIDLDRFKNINDSMGHDAGDALLITVAKRLTQTVRSVDTVARFGGDEFVIVFNEVKLNHLNRLVEKILNAVKRPIVVQGRSVVMTTSIGVSCYPAHGETAEQMIKYADVAMYHAKTQGRNGAEFYAPEMTSIVDSRFNLENRLQGALERNEFFLHYQPQYDLRDGTICGCEALLRWKTDNDMIPPAEFIPIIEENGMIDTIGHWVLQQACAQGAQWFKQTTRPFVMAVNVSPRQFFSVNLAQLVQRELDRSGLPPYALEIEVTESMLMTDADRAIRIMEEISAMGVHIALDDFGTGYSSLNYLKRFPLNKLKVDRSFIQDVLTKEDDATIVAAIISLALALKLQVIAEGIETDSQLNYLLNLDCTLGQGYLFSKPVSAAQFTALLPPP